MRPTTDSDSASFTSVAQIPQRHIVYDPPVLTSTAMSPTLLRLNGKKSGVPWLLFAFVFMLAASSTFYLKNRRSGAETTVTKFSGAAIPDTNLNLRVEAQGDRLLVSWNRQSALVLSAASGILQIHDGSQHRRVELDAGQITAGSVLYKPESNDVTFNLQVLAHRGTTATASVRVLDGTKSSLVQATEPKSPSHVPASLPLSTQLSKSSSTSPAPAVVSSAAQEGAKQEGSGASSALIGHPSPQTHPLASQILAKASSPIVPGHIAPPDIPPPPAILSKASPSLAIERQPDFVFEQPSAPPGLMKSPDTKVDNKIKETSQPQDAGPETPDTGSLSIEKSYKSYKSPRPVKRFVPNRSYRYEVVNRPTHIEVRVTIDETGHVTGARIVHSDTEIAKDLAKSTVLAAKWWVFKPATLRGKPVSSEYTIMFKLGAHTWEGSIQQG